MEKNSNHAGTEVCIHCGKCTRQCLFLKKYGIDIGNTDKLRELAYHCFLCGRCSAVCPKGIDGREIILGMRQEQAQKSGEGVRGKGYGMLLREKEDYLFRNDRHMLGRSVLFPGCNFPSFYPKTTKKLAALLKERADIGVLFDCCGKPVAELGLRQKEEVIIEGLNRRLLANEVEELIMLCPNCYHFLKGRLDVKIVSIYEKIKELGIGRQLEGDMTVFPPCPDRENEEILTHISASAEGRIKTVQNVQCCGLGGCASIKEPGLAKEMVKAIQVPGQETLYTYCATCAGNLRRSGCRQVSHVLVELLGTGEEADIGKSFFNRVKTRFV